MSSHVAKEYIVLEIIDKVLANPQRRISRPDLWKILETNSIQNQHRGAYIGAAKLRKINSSGKGVYYELPEQYTRESFNQKTIKLTPRTISAPTYEPIPMEKKKPNKWIPIIGIAIILIGIAVGVAYWASVLVQSAR